MELNRWQENLLKTLKEEMKLTLDGLTAKNLEEIESLLEEQFDAAYGLLGIERKKEQDIEQNKFSFIEESVTEPSHEADETIEEAVEEAAPAEEVKREPEEEEHPSGYVEPLEQLAESFDEKPTKTGYRMKRNLTGGYLIGAKDGYVPESIVRQEGFEDGDIVAAELSGHQDGRPMYRFSLVEKGHPTSDRSTMDYLIVEKDKEADRFYVERTANGEEIRLDDASQRLVLQTHMVTKYHLQEGDIIDIAWYGNNLSKFSVCWKHRVEDLGKVEKTPEQKVLAHRKNNSAPSGEETSPTSEQFDELKKTFRVKEDKQKDRSDLKGLTVTVVGGYSFHDQTLEVIKKNGGEVNIVPDNTHKNRMTAAIKRSDIVVVFVNEVSHGDMGAARERAKKYGIRFKTMDHFGKERLLNMLLEEKKLVVGA